MDGKVLVGILLLALGAASPRAAMVVASSIPDLGSIASAIGGSRIEVFSVSRADANPHSVEVLPSSMIKVARAKVYLEVGLGLDGWADAIVRGSRNASLLVVDCSRGIDVLEKPAGKVDASMGDVHPEGNPHYWLDPANASILAGTIARALEAADPQGRDSYRTGLAAFRRDLDAKRAGWTRRMASHRDEAVFAYHSSWAYFAKAFGLRISGKVEPVPGIPPNARHLGRLLETAKSENVRILLQEPYFPKDGGRFLGRQAGIAVIELAPSCDGVGPREYLDHFDRIIDAIAGAERP